VSSKKAIRAFGAALSVELGELPSRETAMAAFNIKKGTYDAAKTLVSARRNSDIRKVWLGGKGNNICDVAFRRVRANVEDFQFIPSEQHLMLVEFVRLLPLNAIHAAWKVAQKQHHSDVGGNEETSKRLNELYQSLFRGEK
jgi:hypothetical protein